MKTKLLMILLILSLGFNIGVVLTFGHHWLMKREFDKWPKESSWHKSRIQKMLNLTEEQSKIMDKDRKELHDTIMPIKEELKQKRTELFALLDTDNIDNLKLDKLLTDISTLQMKIEKTVVEHSVSIRKNLTPEQQKKFKAFLKKGFERGPHGPGHMQDNPDKTF